MFIFFFKQKTAYEMRISDWSSDVCSSDLVTKSGPLHAELDNEPSIASPWLYNFVGQPWQTQAIVRAAMRRIWTNSPSGISGNDDLGAMSSWYVWSALDRKSTRLNSSH